MNNVLFLHHFEEMWENGLQGFNTSMDDITTKVIDFLMYKENIDTVFITKMESINPEESHYRLLDYCSENNIDVVFQEYAYAMYRDPDDHDEENDDFDPDNVPYPMEKFGKTWTYGNREHHDQETDVLDIDDFHYELKNVDKLYLAGAFEGECVNDQEKILDTIEAEYEKIDGLVVGTYVDYEFKAYPKVQKLLESELSKIHEFIEDNFEEDDSMEMKKENPDAFEELVEKIEDYIDNNKESLEFISFNLDSDYGIIDQAFESEKYDSFEEFKEELLENIDEIKETNDCRITLEDIELYQNGLLDLSKKKIELSKTYNIEVDGWVQYFNSNEDFETLEAEEKGFKENHIPIVIKIKDNFEDVFQTDLNEVDIDDEISIYEDAIYLSDEQEACSVLMNHDFKSLFIKDESQNKFILIDDEHDIEDFLVKAKIKENWTDYMKPEDLIDEINNKNKVRNRKRYN